MTTTKSTPVSRRTASAKGCRGARVRGATSRRRTGESATESATAVGLVARGVAGVAAGVERGQGDGGDHQDEHDEHLQQQDLTGDRALAPCRGDGHARIVPHPAGPPVTANSTTTRVTAVTGPPTMARGSRTTGPEPEDTMSTTPTAEVPQTRRDRTHYLYIAVIVAVVLGVVVGFVAPEFAVGLKSIGDGFVALIKMMIQPVIFCTIVLGVGSVAQRRQRRQGRRPRARLLPDHVDRRARHRPGRGQPASTRARASTSPTTSPATDRSRPAPSGSTTEFILGIVPDSLLSALTSGEVLQTLLVALLVGLRAAGDGPRRASRSSPRSATSSASSSGCSR